MTDNVIEIKNITKKFGNFTAVKGISFSIKEGEIFGLLGPNGAGKTTTLNMVLGLLHPTTGKILIDGLDNTEHPEKVKNLIGFMTQETVVDSTLTGRQNLEIAARLYHVPENEVQKRIRSSLDEANLTGFADRQAGTYSGGMQRRLNLVKSMIHEPRILILDEPTTGLDVQSRLSMWNHIKNLNKAGVTIILTTQYLEEADSLCDRIAIIDHGEVKAIGTASELKKIVSSGNILDITTKVSNAEEVQRLLKSRFHLESEVKNDRVIATVDGKPIEMLVKIGKALEDQRIEVLAISMHLPTMDDVFIKLTGESMRDSASNEMPDRMIRAGMAGRR